MTAQDYTGPAPLGIVHARPDRDDDVTIRSARLRRWREVARLSRNRPGFLLALAFILFVLVAAIAPAWLTQFDPYATAPLQKLKSPSLVHFFGTDELGRDLYTRVIYGASLSVQAAVLAVAIAFFGGSALGLFAGFFGGRTDSVIMRLIDVLLALPSLLLALSIVTAIGFGTIPVAIAVGFGILPGFARTMRAEVLRVKTLPYVEAARLGGAGWFAVLKNHILPNASGAVLVLATLDFGVAILVASGLSFLGFGAAPPLAEWGTLIANGRKFLMTAPWLSLVPGLFVALAVFSLNHISRTLEEIWR
ncbi:ABC transporter permease [Rhizobiaceae bacterium BDR2-2]|uniref:ABC transporter permease n=1 Tax=Ectorhizobium quercum TaxID=2965071 RepID=A0AAE3N1H2_9HYPH|nr:ABC transporter permease [Ectorhizobium quercum]MCX8998191.1 ABC transporter permease [Ectorhizobium quercum]